jgi:hypothetical protein
LSASTFWAGGRDREQPERDGGRGLYVRALRPELPAVRPGGRGGGSRCRRQMRAQPPPVALPPGDHRDDLTLAAMASDALTLGGAVPERVAELTGVRRVRNDIQIRGLEQA